MVPSVHWFPPMPLVKPQVIPKLNGQSSTHPEHRDEETVAC